MSETKEKRVISREQYLQALGLLTLGAYHRKIVEDCIEALGKTIGEQRPSADTVFDWSSEAVYGGESIEWLLGRVNAEVENADT